MKRPAVRRLPLDSRSGFRYIGVRCNGQAIDRRGKVSACPDIIMRFCDSRRSSGYLNTSYTVHGGESQRLDVMRKAEVGPDALVLRFSTGWMPL